MADAVRAKYDDWKRRLLDLSGRNRLLSFRPTRRGTLNLSGVAVGDLFDALVLDGSPIEFRGLPEVEDNAGGTGGDDLPTLVRSNSGLTITLDRTEKDLRSTLTNLYRRSRESMLEQGIHTLHLALGFLKWHEIEHSDVLIGSPLLFVPVQLTRKRGGMFSLEPTGESPEANIVLAEKLRRDLSVELPEWQEEDDADPNLQSYLAEVRHATESLERSGVVEEAVLDIFSFAKLVMYKDLERNTERALDNELIRGLCGEPSEPPQIDAPEGEELDRRLSYNDCFHVLDADTSQREAIAAATAGESFILVGPPGTGKSQTIANIIAESVATGRRVLFVSEKAAALEVVYRRLAEVGLHYFCLDLHSARGSKIEVLDQLKRALGFEPPDDRYNTDYSVLEDERARLNAYSRALHEPFGRLDWTPFRIHGELAKLEDVPLVIVPVEAVTADDVTAGSALGAVDARRIAGMESAISACEDLEDVFRQGEDHPWWGYRYSVDSAVDRKRLQDALEQLRDTSAQAAKLHAELNDIWGIALAETVDGMDALTDICQSLIDIGGRPVEEAWLGNEPLGEHRHAAAACKEISTRLATAEDALRDRYEETVYELDPDMLSERFAEYQASWLKRTFTSGADRRMLRNHMRDSGARVDFAGLMSDVSQLQLYAEAIRWFEGHAEEHQSIFGDYYQGPRTDWTVVIELLEAVGALNDLLAETGYSAKLRATLAQKREPGTDVESLQNLQQRLTRCGAHLRKLAAYFLCDSFRTETEERLGAVPVEELREWAERRITHFEELDTWQRYRRLRADAREHGVSRWISHFLENPEDAARANDLFRKSFRRQWLDEVRADRTALMEFTVEDFERVRGYFAARDRSSIDHGATRVQQEIGQRRGDVRQNAGIGQVHTLRRELGKRRRHKPVRQLLGEIPELAQKLAPCMMMSPLTVSQYLGSDRLEFDLVVFDEASQVKPEDALAAIMRGSQLILSGDPKQLPPTTFFDAAIDDSADDDMLVESLESILDETSVWLRERLLRWHYRSRDDILIAFSNHEFYDSRLVTFPDSGNGESLGLTFVHCSKGVYDRGGTRTNRVEAEKVADLTVEVLEAHPSDGIGIVAFSQAQQDAIYDVFEERARSDLRFEKFLSDSDEQEGLFIKNLETVQGDERDTIIISVGYGPDAEGRLTMNFGPLNQTGGSRRLNVAVTRARKRLLLVSSMTAQDIALSASASAQLLRRYLDFATRGREALQTSGSYAVEPESPFEEAVRDALLALGLQVESQVGCGPYRIDLGILDPERPGRYLLGVECDGRTYHSSPTARDRDRLREQVLEDRGWRILRVWSTDWWRNPQAQIDRIMEAVERARDERNDETSNACSPLEAQPQDDQSSLFPALSEATDDETPSSEADEPEGPDYGFAVYEPVNIGRLGKQDAFYRMAGEGSWFLKERVRLIVKEEGPVHFDVVMKRLTEAYGISRCGSRVRELMLRCVASTAQTGFVDQRGDFLWPPGDEEPVVRTNEGSEFQRHISQIALEELALAAAKVVEIAHGATEDDVVREVARALGFARTGNEIRERIEEAIGLAVERGAIIRAGDELLPSE